MTSKSTQNRLRVAAAKPTPAPVATPALPASLEKDRHAEAKAAPAPEPVKAAPAPEQPAPAPAPVPAAKAKPTPTKKFADIDPKAVGTRVITVLTRNPDGSIKNPKVASGAPAKRFALYADGMTVEAALKVGVTDGRCPLGRGA